ncbi:ccr4 associated factor [Talaromyces marneffei ATCC 18224]|uniref:Zn(2)-C6 fungal-type domain-containing protein n=1 Tax=Talaromyces marneffei (strain ATCC 18224 / CBS 334.59 / QM 7333) TaxID=441960 RepID=B6QVR7_TALMQ|nr:uncharacterized protein EYB26_009880 [Talaromyces marneffei]EEA19130.1 conserved hypothetical protein [Talaromyces marneffei ATCC 18224]KAE8548823.1 hypothetical protein EYB25_009204 [Talaromyces marneffei]QGA22166.1 hypothetical protein EYB26_009880 [Talaromyces marneffei]
MTGVAGGSRGCHTCRKRKIKCDGGRPTCKQCARGLWTCEGYNRTLAFRNHSSSTFSHKRRHYRRGNATQIDSLTTPSAQHIAHVSYAQNAGILADDRLLEPQSFAQAANQALYDQSFSSFITLCLPERASMDVPLAWLLSLHHGSIYSKTLSLAAAGVGYGWIGHEVHSSDALYLGRSLYCSALSSAQDLLNGSKYTEGLLPTIMMLLLYELFEFGTQSSLGWKAHASGIETILQLYAPQIFTKPLGFQLFYSYRTIGVLRSLTTRKSTFLSEAEWIDIPWSLGAKNSYHQFLDLAAEVPSILEQIDRLSAGNSLGQCEQTPLERLARQTLDLIHRMKEWEEFNSLRLAQGPPHTFSSSGTSMNSTDRLQPRVHRYPSRHTPGPGTDFDELQSARLMLFNWAVTLTLYISLYDKVPVRPYLGNMYWNESSHPISIRGLEFEAEALAYRVTLWADFCCQNAWQSFGPAIGIFSVKAAIQWYEARLKTGLPGTSQVLAQEQLQKCRTLLEHLTYSDRGSEFTL